MTLDPIVVWFLLGLALALLELAVPGIILIFFGLGAWIVSVTTYFGLTTSSESQLLLFGVASIVLLVLVRRKIKGKFYGHVSAVQDLEEDMNEFKGRKVVVLKDIAPGEMGGVVEFKGTRWNAISKESIREGEMAMITGVDGITLNVQKNKEE